MHNLCTFYARNWRIAGICCLLGRFRVQSTAATGCDTFGHPVSRGFCWTPSTKLHWTSFLQLAVQKNGFDLHYRRSLLSGSLFITSSSCSTQSGSNFTAQGYFGRCQCSPASQESVSCSGNDLDQNGQDKRSPVAGNLEVSRASERTWIERVLPRILRSFSQLARLDMPTGTWLLAWPCFWSICVAAPAGTMLSFPGSLSADEKEAQLYISDTNHHRIIIVDGNGKILDYIGSSPGFEDGTFERARLFCPSSTVFDEHHDCLYIADSKNHVIRRADLRKRTVDTVGRNTDKNEDSMWSRFSKWMQSVGLARKDHNQHKEEDVKRGKDNAILSNPCHLKLAADGSLIVASQGFESLWVIDPNSGQCSRISCEGSEAVNEFKRRSDASGEISEAFGLLHPTSKQPDMVSRFARIRNDFFYADTEGHIVRKMDLQTGRISTLQLSNYGCLGLPAWWSIHPLSLLKTDSRESGSVQPSTSLEDIMCHKIQVQPGRCLICINPVLPEGVALAAPVDDRSVWRQARGSVVELSTFGGRFLSHKVSGAQLWVDDLDDLDTDFESFGEFTAPQQSEHGLPLYSYIDASLGSGEVLVDAVLYLKTVCSCSTDLSSGGSKVDIESSDEKTNSSLADKPSVLKYHVRDQEDSLCLRHLHVRVRIEVASTASSERTNVISVPL